MAERHPMEAGVEQAARMRRGIVGVGGQGPQGLARRVDVAKVGPLGTVEGQRLTFQRQLLGRRRHKLLGAGRVVILMTAFEGGRPEFVDSRLGNLHLGQRQRLGEAGFARARRPILEADRRQPEKCRDSERLLAPCRATRAAWRCRCHGHSAVRTGRPVVR
jgi:hypothetical protein